MSDCITDDTIYQPQTTESYDDGDNRNDIYFTSLVTFRVDGELFRVNRAPFDESAVFVSKFNLPPPDLDASELIEVPEIDIDGVKKKDFLALLKVLLPRGLSSKKVAEPIDLSDEEWMTVVALASEWDFPETRELAKDKLQAIDPIKKIGLAQQYDIPEWLYSSYAVLTMRETSLSDDEAEMLGGRLSLKLSKAHEELCKANLSFSQSVESNNLGKTVLQILVNLFGEDVRTYLKDDDKIFSDTDEVDGSKVMGRATMDLGTFGDYTVSVACDQIVEVMEFGSPSHRWSWKVKTSDGQIGITSGGCLFPFKEKYQYNSKGKAKRDSSEPEDFPRQLKYTKGQIIELDNSYPRWNCLPAKLNDVEGFVFVGSCDYI